MRDSLVRWVVRSVVRPTVRCVTIVAVAALMFASAAFVHAQGAPQSMEGKTAEQVYKNIKVLTGTPADQLNPAMHLIRSALGVECEFCHVAGAFEKDDLPRKEVARKMMQMMMDINKNSFATCRWSPATPAIAAMPIPRIRRCCRSSMQPEEPKVQLPSVDEVLAKYVAALGGEQAIRKITSRVITGTQDLPTRPRRRSATAGGDRTRSEGAELDRQHLPRSHVHDFRWL